MLPEQNILFTIFFEVEIQGALFLYLFFRIPLVERLKGPLFRDFSLCRLFLGIYEILCH